MESNSSPATLCTLHSQFVGHVQACTASESKAAKLWNLGVLSAPLHLSSVGSGLCPEKAVAAEVITKASLQSRFADGEISTPLSPHGLEQGCLNALIPESRTCRGVREASGLPAAGFCSQTKGCLNCEDVADHMFLPPSAQPDKLEVNVYETCQKRFVIFDQTGSMKKILFFPAMVHELSSLLRCSLKSQRDYVEHLQIESVGVIDQWKETMANLIQANITGGESGLIHPRKDANITVEESGLLCAGKDLQSGFGILPGKKCEGLQPVIFMGGEVPSPSLDAPGEAEALSQGSGNEVSLDCKSFSHEDTDDLEALLSSDDELSSTGHSPSDVSTINFPKSSNDYCRDCSSLNSVKKRKRKFNNYCSDDDADSGTATSAYIQMKYLKHSSTDIFHTGSGSLKSATFKQYRDTGFNEEFAAFAMSFPEEINSRNRSVKHRVDYKEPLPEKQGPAKRARKKKIKQTFQTLRNIIPGGDCKNTEFVLDEVIQYVKSLQVKVQKLEAKKLI